MKNQYEMKQTYLITLENEQLRERLKEMADEIRELKKKYDAKERVWVVQDKGINSIIQE
jgi:regulator of replication initiation timing